MNKARLKRLETQLRTTAVCEGGFVIILHPDGSGTDSASGICYTAAEIADRERKGQGWLVGIPEENPHAYNRLARLERLANIHAGADWDPAQAAGLWSEEEALALLECITDAELDALALGGPDDPPATESLNVKTTSDTQLAAVIFSAAPDLLARCRERLAEKTGTRTL